MQGKIENDVVTVPIEVFGVSRQTKQQFQAVVDTGYQGYVSLPFSSAFPVGLVLRGQQSYTLADGSVSSHFICLGTVIFDGHEVVVPIDVQSNGPTLIGTEFLKKIEANFSANFSQAIFEITSEKRKKLQPLKDVKVSI